MSYMLSVKDKLGSMKSSSYELLKRVPLSASGLKEYIIITSQSAKLGVQYYKDYKIHQSTVPKFRAKDTLDNSKSHELHNRVLKSIFSRLNGPDFQQLWLHNFNTQDFKLIETYILEPNTKNYKRIEIKLREFLIFQDLTHHTLSGQLEDILRCVQDLILDNLINNIADEHAEYEEIVAHLC